MADSGGSPPSGWTAPGLPDNWSSPPPGPGWGPPPGAAPAPPPRPGVIPLRPLSVGEVLEGAFAVLRRHPGAAFGWSAVVLLITNAITVLIGVLDGTLGSAFSGTGLPGGGLLGSGGPLAGRLLALVVEATGEMVLIGFLAAVVAEAVLGRPVSFRSAGRRVQPRLGALLVGGFVAACAPYAGLVLLVLPGLFLWGALTLTAPAVVLEGLGAGAALRRSWRLAVPDFWRVWGTRALGYVIAAAVSMLVLLPAVLVGALLTRSLGAPGGPLLVIVTGATLLGSVLTQPFLGAVVALLYVDRRIRGEALDLVLAQAAGSAGPGAAPTRVE